MTKTELESKYNASILQLENTQKAYESLSQQQARVVSQANMIASTLSEIDIMLQSAPVKRKFNILNIFTYVKELSLFIETIIRLISELKERLKNQENGTPAS